MEHDSVKKHILLSRIAFSFFLAQVESRSKVIKFNDYIESTTVKKCNWVSQIKYLFPVLNITVNFLKPSPTAKVHVIYLYF